MIRNKFFLTVVVIFLFLHKGYPENMRVIFLGITSDSQTEFDKKINDGIYWEISKLPKVEMIKPDKIQHLRDMGELKSGLLSSQELQQLSKRLNGDFVLYGKIKNIRITPRRLWYLPLNGYYYATLELDLFLYDFDNKSLRFSDSFVISCEVKKGFSGLWNFNRNMTLSAEYRVKVYNSLISSISKDVYEKLDVNMKGLREKNKVKASDLLSEIESEDSLDDLDTLNAEKDTTEIKK